MRGTSQRTTTPNREKRHGFAWPGVILLMLALLVPAGCAGESDAWERIAASGVLRIGVDPTFPPFALAEGAELEGLDIDLGRSLAKEMGLEPQFTYFGYDGLYDALTTGQVDVLVSALVIAPERTKDVAYTTSYFDAGQFLVIGGELTGVNSVMDLGGKTLAVELGAMGHVLAQEWQGRMSDLGVQTHASSDEALAAVSIGEADAALVDSVSARLYLREHSNDAPGLKLLTEPVSSEPYAIATRIGDKMLLRELNAALLRLINSGRMDAIINQWLGL